MSTADTGREPGFRASVRSLLRDRILDAAVDLAARSGWKEVRMVDIAERAQVSRRTVFNEFASKSGVLEAMAWRNIERLISGATAQVDLHREDPPAAIAAAARYMLTTAADDPLYRSVMAGDPASPDEILSVLTTRSGQFIDAATAFSVAWAQANWTHLELDSIQLTFVFDSLIRLVVSHMVQPARASVDEVATLLGWLAAPFFPPSGDAA